MSDKGILIGSDNSKAVISFLCLILVSFHMLSNGVAILEAIFKLVSRGLSFP